MRRLALGLSLAMVTLGSVAVAQTDPNTPTGPYNPNTPAVATGMQGPPPCAPAANTPGKGAGGTSPGASAAPPQATQGDRQAGEGKEKPPPTDTGCAGQEHPPGAAPAPANGPHP